ncbi:MAG: thiamine ABC transporter ATP-binding protein [Acidiferrobacteraceae bacterium]|nr:thiamine ABC transporter ATP-binding protein [Acidiferrobacteraceae bacterium]
MAFLTLDNLHFSWGDWQLEVSTVVDRNRCVALIGPSGAGKSTLLSLIAGFETPDQGRILVDDKDVTGRPPAQRPVTMMFQEHNLFAHLSLYDNVALGRHPGLKLTVTDSEVVREALATAGLADLEERLPADVSGGQRQRAALARCLCQQRPLLLLDEPFTSLEPALRQEMHQLVDRLRRKHNLTVILISHLPFEAAAVAQEVLFMHSGRVVEQGPSRVIMKHPKTPELRAYLQFPD